MVEVDHRESNTRRKLRLRREAKQARRAKTPRLDEGAKWFYTQFYPGKGVCRPVHMDDKVVPRLRESTITFFTPIGPRYSWEKRGTAIKPGDPEVAVLEYLAELWSTWREHMPGKELRWFFLGADLYGTQINGLPAEVVQAYFEEWKAALTKYVPGSTFALWSECVEEAAPYFPLKANKSGLQRYLPDRIICAAEHTAGAMRRGGDPYEYLAHRVAEADWVEEKFKPIKCSLVVRHKDEFVDRGLPRLYLLPQELHAPWLR